MQQKKRNKKIKSDKENDIKKVKEIGGRKGPEPTRYGDWEKNGRCIDFQRDFQYDRFKQTNIAASADL